MSRALWVVVAVVVDKIDLQIEAKLRNRVLGQRVVLREDGPHERVAEQRDLRLDDISRTMQHDSCGLLGAPYLGAPHYKLVCPYLALFSKMCV